MEEITTCHLVLGEDLNHHRTLFAGHATEWFVEAGYIAATTFLGAKDLVCLAIHDLYFTRPVPAGETVSITASVVYAGRTSLVSYVSAVIPSTREMVLEGYVQFVHVDKDGKAKPHGLRILAETEREKMLQNKAASLSENR